MEFPQPPPDECKPVVVSELGVSRQPDQPPLWMSFPHPFPFALSAPVSLTGSFCAVSVDVVQVLFEEPQPDEPHVLSDEPQALLDEFEDAPQVVPDEPQALSDEV